MRVRDYSDTTVILPTLNENDNIGGVVRKITGSYRGASVIIADDGSTDGTIFTAMELSKRNGRVILLDRSTREVHGITASVLDAAELVKTKKTIVMDADMQHPPGKIGDISSMLDRDELVVAVRTRVRNWGPLRTIVSKGAAYFSYGVFRLRGKRTCNDMMSGFFGIRTQLFKELKKRNRNGFVGRGYKILLDILRLMGDGAIGEVEYSTFHRRERGQSKLGPSQLFYVAVSTLKK